MTRIVTVRSTLLAILFSVVVSLSGQTLSTFTLAWDAPADPSVTGYRLVWGATSGLYTASQDVGNVTSAPFTYDPAQPYYIAVESYNATGILSAPSNEVSKIPAPIPTPLTLTCPAKPTLTSATGAPVVATFAPVSAGGVAPVTVACVPPSGSAFPVGTTAVSCTAADSASHQATCGFSVTVSYTAPPPPPPPPSSYSLWSAATTAADDADPTPAEVGTRFSTDTAGAVTGARFFKPNSLDAGTHTASLWTNSGTLLARATFTNETSSGWQTVAFAAPVTLAVNTPYVISYYTPQGHYAGAYPYFTAPLSAPPLHAYQDGVNGPNGAYVYASGPTFPIYSWNAEAYFIDVIFVPVASGPPPPPVACAVPSGPTPPTGSTYRSIDQDLAWVGSAGCTYTVKFGTSATPPTVATNVTATNYSLTRLAHLTTYHWQIVASNGAGSVSGPVWSFTTR